MRAAAASTDASERAGAAACIPALHRHIVKALWTDGHCRLDRFQSAFAVGDSQIGEVGGHPCPVGAIKHDDVRTLISAACTCSAQLVVVLQWHGTSAALWRQRRCAFVLRRASSITAEFPADLCACHHLQERTDGAMRRSVTAQLEVTALLGLLLASAPAAKCLGQVRRARLCSKRGHGSSRFGSLSPPALAVLRVQEG